MQRLRIGDQIGIFSPSSPATVTAAPRFNRAKQFLTEKGFQIIEGQLTGKQDGYRSGSPKERAEELNQLIRNPDIKMIMSTIGGTNSNSMLPYIDYEAFQLNPKLIVGYSDVTVILLAIYAKTGIPTYYGPAFIPSFGEFEPLVYETYRYFEQFFIRKQKLPYSIDIPSLWTEDSANWLEKTHEKKLQNNEWITVNSGIAEGRLIGGNLNAIYGSIGSPFMPKFKKGDILLIEDSIKNAETVEKNFAMLKNHGVFNLVSGILVGKYERFDDMGTEKKPYEILTEIIDNPSIPILAEFDSCHTHPMIPMPIGKKVSLDAANKTVELVENWIV
ncbi:S66 family peptidase [Lysinibacillus sp. NPDC047702]|uniref:S66 family peptidase n=1 Tax=unclassified Lysinibacillus TaxID=2636778 RepID=UPI003D00C326